VQDCSYPGALQKAGPRLGLVDVVAYPRDEAGVQAVLDWAGDADATVTSFGGATFGYIFDR
jgi:FAD/FMN-containing dehydrogenase